MKAKVTGVSAWQGVPISGTLDIKIPQRYVDSDGNATVAHYSGVLRTDGSGPRWVNALNPNEDLWTVVQGPLDPIGPLATFHEIVSYGPESDVRTTFTRRLVSSDLSGLLFDYAQPAPVNPAGFGAEPLTMQAARQLLGFVPTLEQATGEFEAVLADIEQLQTNNQAATAAAVLDVGREIQASQDNRAALNLVLSLGIDVPAPLYIENYSAFHQIGYPNDVSTGSDPAKVWEFKVTGVAGDRWVTYVATGSLSPLTEVGSKSWAAALKHDNGEVWTYDVQGYDVGTGKIHIEPPLRSAVTAQVLGNVHWQGNHYSDYGYTAYAHHLWRTTRRKATRELFIAQFRSSDTTGPWVAVGGFVPGGYLSDGTTIKGSTYNSIINQDDASVDGVVTSIGSASFRNNMEVAGQGHEWTVALDGARGDVESYIGLVRGAATFTLMYDGVTVLTQPLRRGLNYIRHPYYGVKSATARITLDASQITTYKIGTTTWWLRAGEPSGTPYLVDWSKKGVLLMDSWGVFMNAPLRTEVVKKELSALITAAGMVPNIVNRSLGGMTSRWARWWFDQYVAAEKPAWVIIGYFTNDVNAVATVMPKPDGTTAAIGPVNKEEWKENLMWMVDRCLDLGIQPIVMMPSGGAGLGQNQSRGIWAETLAQGIITVPPKSASSTVNTSLVKGGGGTGGGFPVVYESAQPNSSARTGHLFKTTASVSGGNHLTVQDSAGAEVLGVRAVERRVSAGAFEATQPFARHFTTPNGAFYETGNSLFIDAQSGKTINDIRLGKKVRFLDGMIPATYTVATLPSAGAAGTGAYAQVSDPAAGKSNLVRSDGTNWRYVAIKDGTAV